MHTHTHTHTLAGKTHSNKGVGTDSIFSSTFEIIPLAMVDLGFVFFLLFWLLRYADFHHYNSNNDKGIRVISLLFN